MTIRRYFSFRPFIDVLFCCLLMLVAILFVLKSEEEQTKMRPPNVLYEVILTWDGESEDDLDIYVQAASGHVVNILPWLSLCRCSPFPLLTSSPLYFQL